MKPSLGFSLDFLRRRLAYTTAGSGRGGVLSQSTVQAWCPLFGNDHHVLCVCFAFVRLIFHFAPEIRTASPLWCLVTFPRDRVDRQQNSLQI